MAEYIDAPTKAYLFNDEVKMIVDMLEEQWSLGVKDRPTPVGYMPEQMMTDTITGSRLGQVFVYMVSRRNTPSSIDYQTLQRSTRISIKVSTRGRDTLFRWCDEIYRILMANRRTGVARNEKYNLGSNTFLEILGDRQTSDMSGWYSDTIDVELTAYHAPIRSSGYGNDINREIHTEDSDTQ